MRRDKGFGTLVPKGKGRPWLARWTHRGTVYTKSTGETDRRRALKELERLTRPFREEREADALRAVYARLKAAEENAAKKDPPLDEVFEAWRKLPCAADVGGTTMEKYEGMASRMAAFMEARGRRTASEVSSEDAGAYLEDVAARCGAGAYNVRLALMKRLWTELGLGPGPFDGFGRRRAPKESPRRALTEKERTRLLEEAAKDPDDLLLVSLGMYAGARLSDAALMKAGSADLDAGLLRYTPVKTRRCSPAPLEVPMAPALKAVLEEAVRGKEPGDPLSERNARMYASGALAVRMKNLFARAGLETSREEDGRRRAETGFHALRHTFVSMALDAGMSPMLVRRLVGHSTSSMTDRYYHADPKKARELVEKMPGWQPRHNKDMREENDMTEDELLDESARELGVDRDKLKALLEKWRRVIGRGGDGNI